MADRTVRAIFEANVSGAQKGMRALAQDVEKIGKTADGLKQDLDGLDGLKVEPTIDVKIDEAKKRLSDITLELADLKDQEATPEVKAKIEDAQKRLKEVRTEIKDLTGQKAEVRVEAAIGDAQKRLKDITLELGELRTMKASPEVDVQIKDAQKRLADTKRELRELSGAKAEMTVTADTSGVESAFDDVGDAGAEAGAEAGSNIGSGIVGALKSIPIAGAVVGVGAAIAGGILLGIKQGLEIEAERDLFSARTGMDEATAARFGRAAGEAYASAWGESIADNLETARMALEQGLIDADAIDRDIEQVIASLSGLSTIMQTDIGGAARAAGQMIKTGLVDNAAEAFDVLVAGFQNGANASQDLLETFEEYGTHFRDLGLSAAEATGLMIQGLEGGAFNADKVADALKELTIKVKELPEDTQAAFDTLKLNGEAMSAAFAEGGTKAREALDDILTALAGVEDPAERARLAVSLFGTQAEDMAGALANLDLSTAAAELGEYAGAADRALATLGDNAATKIEEAWRSIETAANGIKGALAAAFADEISSAAEWVSRNRAPMMEFFAAVIDGAFEMAKALVGFGATALETVASVMESFSQMQDILYIIAPASRVFFDDFGDGADTLRQKAADMRDGVISSLNESQSAAQDWALPLIMEARVHDATVAMAAEMDAFSAYVDEAGGTVTINGDAMNAEQVLDALIGTIDGEDGTVTINGQKVPAEQALATLMQAIDSSKGDVTVGAYTGPANRAIGGLKAIVDGTQASIKVDANTGPADRAIESFIHRGRTVYIDVVARGGIRVPGSHEGGWIKGLNAGGWVPGKDPGYDNVLWPLNSGGRTLTQPLTGGEYVVNSKDSAFWGQALEWMNAGGRPAASSPAPAAVRLDPADIDRLAAEVGRRVEAGANRGIREVGRGLR